MRPTETCIQAGNVGSHVPTNADFTRSHNARLDRHAMLRHQVCDREFLE